MIKSTSTRFFFNVRAGSLWIVLLTALMLGLSACNKGDEEAVVEPKQGSDRTMQRILSMGFAQKNVVDKGNYYLVEGDIMFDKDESTSKTPITKDGVIAQYQDQIHEQRFVAYAKQPNITVRIDPSIPATWRADMEQAVNDWNSIEACHINLTLTSASADITITRGSNMAPREYGSAPLPSNGNPGNVVFMNVDTTPDNVRRKVATHELGHCLGLGHTDVFNTGEIRIRPNATVIAGTPDQDPESIMNSGGAPNQGDTPWTRFSQFDIVAIQNLYPPISSVNTYEIVARHSGKSLDVTARSQGNGAPVTQHDYLGGANQHWQLQDRGDGYFDIVARHSGKLLDVTYGSQANSAPVSQHDDLNVPNQQWKLIPIGDGYYIIQARHSGKALDVTYGSQANGAQVAQHDYLGVANQQWKLVPIR